MKGKLIVFNEEATEKVKAGINTLTNAVKVTLGPKGRNVAIGNPFGTPIVTKDGVSVAREIVLKDPIENIGAQLVKEVAQKTADVAGDGTTTATLLAQSIFTEGLKAIRSGANPMFLKKGIEIATKQSIEAIRKLSKDVDEHDLYSVASVSSNNEELGKLIADAMKEAGMDGVITVEESQTFDTYSQGVEGMEISRGYIAPYFINTETLNCELEDCLILITDKTINNHMQILPAMDFAAKNGRPLLVVAANVEGSALSIMILNNMKGQLKCCAIKAPYFGENRNEALSDLAAATGGVFMNETLGMDLEHITLNEFGQAEKISVSKNACTIINGKRDEERIKQRIEITKQQIEKTDSDFEKEKAQERLARLTNGVIVLYIGAATETELKEKKARVEDALNATRAAIEEGIVPGGGIVYLYASKNFENPKELDPENSNSKDIIAGIKIVKDALKAPLYQICTNAGLTPEVIYEKINEGQKNSPRFGYDVISDKYGDLIELGITDPTKVAVTAIANAASVAGMLLTLEAIVVDDFENETTERQPAIPMNMHGMM